MLCVFTKWVYAFLMFFLIVFANKEFLKLILETTKTLVLAAYLLVIVKLQVGENNGGCDVFERSLDGLIFFSGNVFLAFIVCKSWTIMTLQDFR